MHRDAIKTENDENLPPDAFASGGSCFIVRAAADVCAKKETGKRLSPNVRRKRIRTF